MNDCKLADDCTYLETTRLDLSVSLIKHSSEVWQQVSDTSCPHGLQKNKILTSYLSPESGNISYSESQYFKMTKNQDVDMNPRLSRNEALLHVTDFDKACHSYSSN